MLFASEKSLVLALPTALPTLQWKAPLKRRQGIVCPEHLSCVKRKPDNFQGTLDLWALTQLRWLAQNVDLKPPVGGSSIAVVIGLTSYPQISIWFITTAIMLEGIELKRSSASLVEKSHGDWGLQPNFQRQIQTVFISFSAEGLGAFQSKRVKAPKSGRLLH